MFLFFLKYCLGTGETNIGDEETELVSPRTALMNTDATRRFINALLSYKLSCLRGDMFSVGNFNKVVTLSAKTVLSGHSEHFLNIPNLFVTDVLLINDFLNSIFVGYISRMLTRLPCKKLAFLGFRACDKRKLPWQQSIRVHD